MNEQGSSTRLFIPALGGFYDAVSGLGYPLIRFFTGLILMPHGAGKLFGWFGGRGIEGTAAGFAKMGLEPALPLATLVGVTEFFGGLLVAIGLLTRPAAIGIVAIMAVAVFQVHLKNGFFWFNGGYEYPLLWGIIGIAILFRGGGALSVDRKIGREF
ncbi:MAG: DoxX family protein [Proteobacteria bacterium]|nr:DoxX family protein [Pseudomonadota bacterium]